MLILMLLVLAGCDTSVEKSVTADYNTSEPRTMETIALPPDSLSVSAVFRKGIGSSSYTLTGRYGDTEAFSVFRFNVSNINKDNVIDAFVVFDIDNTWDEGDVAFDIYDTRTDWADSTLIEGDDFLDGLGESLATIANDDSLVANLTFNIGSDIIKSWDDAGALLVKSSDSGESMVSILSDNTNYSPKLQLVKLYSDGDIDTTGVYATEGTYWFNSAKDEDYALLSEGGGNGFVLDVSYDGFLPEFATVNRCVVTMSVPSSLISESSLDLDVYRLEDEFEDLANAGLATEDLIRINLKSDMETFTLDIADILNDWHIGGAENHGLLFQPVDEGSSPGHCFLSVIDSVYITYTPFPKID